MLSMTGYGRGVCVQQGREITVELKSVNHRFLDIAFRMPRSFAFLEDAMRTCIQERLSRGHVDLFVTYRNLREDARCVVVDEALVKAYALAVEKIALATGARGDISATTLAKLPDVFCVLEAQEDQPALRELTLQALDSALEQILKMRKAEGTRIGADMQTRLCAVEEMTKQVSERAPLIVVEYQKRLSERVNELMQGVPLELSRIVQEVALYTDRVNIDEEIVRMNSHLSAMRQTMTENVAVGRRMDFIVQEMNREANTMGSKASDIRLLDHVVHIKSELEKIREQVQNIE